MVTVTATVAVTIAVTLPTRNDRSQNVVASSHCLIKVNAIVTVTVTEVVVYQRLPDYCNSCNNYNYYYKNKGR